MNNRVDPIVKSAIEWNVKLAAGSVDDWEAFTRWLEEDPRHVEAYDRVEAMEHRLDLLLPEAIVERSVDSAPSRNDRRTFLYWGGGALAASLVAALLWPVGGPASRYEIATARGETRVVRLGAKTEVTINGDTRIIFDRTDPRFASLVSGQALFRVDHDAGAPFTVEMGDARVVDLGTIFDIRREPAGIRVAVSEGEVEYQDGDTRIGLVPGQSLSARPGDRPVVTATPTDAVGAWERGRLLYSGAPLSEVARDLARALGVEIDIAPAIESRPFSGNLTLDGTGEAQIARLGLALDVRFRRSGAGWTMEPAGSAGK